MDDLISRQAAINIVKSRKTAEQCEKGVVRNWAVDLCVDALEKLPSAQPELDIGNDGTLYISVSKGQLDKINRVLVEEDGSIFCKQFY